MAKNLVIVESPAKAKTIEGFLGKDFLVKSSFGHVRDLVKKGLGVDIEKNFTPTYEISPDKKHVIDELKKLAGKADTVWLATDEDREGEAISWHLYESLDLKKKETKRIVFHEITKPAILRAIETPRSIDINLVDAQQARRILDRLVGFELSPILWKKIKPSLSAGRVQSVAVRLIVDREREIQSFVSTSAFRVTAVFMNSQKVLFKAELPVRFPNEKLAMEFLQKCSSATFTVEDLETKPAKKSPSAPFTTSTLQQEASRKLGFSVSQTMVLAQRLYESGKITYMRTDSVNLSDTAIDAARREIVKNYGKEYHQPRQFKTKAKGAQEAHEAIRPTYLENSTVDGDSGEKRLYDLIWKRTIASQMAEAQLEKTTATIGVSTATEKFIAQGEVLKFDGFLKVYMESTDDDEKEEQEGMLPALKVGENVSDQEINAVQRFSHHPPRFTEASLVKKLEELGIGRPSTYAPTISTIQQRGYVVKEDREGVKRNFLSLSLKGGRITEEVRTENTGAEKSKLFPTDIGMVVNDFLVKHFEDVLDFNFTATVEKEFDDIAEGKLKWPNMIKEFYKPFHKDVEKTLVESERVSGERLLGKDPVSGKNVYVRIGRFGPMVQVGEADDAEKPKYAGLKKDQRLETITFEEALELFKLPRKVGVFEGTEMTVGAGRFGPYVKHANSFYSLKKEDDPNTITEERAIQLILDKRKADIEKIIRTFPQNADMKILKGRWGPYLAVGKDNYRLPKDKEAADLTYEDCVALMDNQKSSQPKMAANKKGSATKTTTKSTAKGSPKRSVTSAAKKKTSTTAKKTAASKSKKKS